MDTFAQVTIPLLVLLAFRVNTRKILVMLPFTMVLDLDVFFTYHRLLFHNIFVAFLFPLMITLYVYEYKREYFDYALIAFFYVFTSMLFDLGEGIALFYPVMTDFYFFKASMYIQLWGPIPLPDFHIELGTIAAETTAAIGERLGAAETASRYPSMSETSAGLLFTILIAAAMYFEKTQTFLKILRNLLRDIFEKIKSILIIKKK